MSFSFTGLIADHAIEPSPRWGSSCRFVAFTEPFAGTLIRITGALRDEAGRALIATARAWTKETPQVRLLALEYETWGGVLERCAGFILHDGGCGTARQSGDDEAEDVFAALFANLGQPLAAGNFAPFGGIARS